VWEVDYTHFPLLESGEQVLGGVYLILDRNSDTGYIGKSNNIIGRFREHQKALNKGSHYNAAFQAALCLTKVESNFVEFNFAKNYYCFHNFVFLVLQVDLPSEEERTFLEKRFIETWPGELFNVISACFHNH
jgi:hypothetical protein